MCFECITSSYLPDRKLPLRQLAEENTRSISLQETPKTHHQYDVQNYADSFMTFFLFELRLDNHFY